MNVKTARKILAVVMTVLIILNFFMLFAVMAGAEEAVSVPEEVIRISEELGQEYNLCPETIQAVGWVESRFDAEAENDGCIGIMQVSEQWHQERMNRLGVADLKDTRGNMTVAADYSSELAVDEEDLEVALMRYHGESRVFQRLEKGEMSDYVDKVLSVSAMLERLHGK